jgi:glyoxylase-like metal-dependent hydrolase (beta-lactamase superfamily II)
VKWSYKKGLHDLGAGAYAWLAPDGSWGWSNAGLVVDGDESLLVDTLFDLALTREMLEAMRGAEPRAARAIRTLVNTHANGDHCHGNQLVEGAEIIASTASAREMEELPPEALAALLRQIADDPSPAARFMRHIFGPFRFDGIRHTPPTRTFDGELAVRVGSKEVRLIEVGPAHTRGDLLVHVPANRTVFAGDILFIDGTPIMWSGPIQRWIDACRRIEAMDVEVVVPGHGPITDRSGAVRVRGYLEYVRDEARKRFDAGLDAWEAAKDIELREYSSWGDAERIVVTVDRLYGEFSGKQSPPDVATLFGRMAALAGA